MGDIANDPGEGNIADDPKKDDPPVSKVSSTPAASASPQVICQEFLKVLSRKEVEQPMIW